MRESNGEKESDGEREGNRGCKKRKEEEKRGRVKLRHKNRSKVSSLLTQRFLEPSIDKMWKS